MPHRDTDDHLRPDAAGRGADFVALDATDRYILDEAPHVHPDALRQPGQVAVVDDRVGMLTLGAIAMHGASDVRVVQDSIVSERALQANAGTFGHRGFHHPETLADAFRGARLVLMRLTKSHDRLDEIARAVARFAAPDVVLLCGGRTKHMALSQNDVLRRSFGDVTATRGRGKSRLLIASDPLQAAAARAAITHPWPRRVHVDELGITVAAHGGVFAGPSLDLGTRVLLGAMDGAVPEARIAVDLGSGSGIIATVLAQRRPDIRIIATDVSAAAIASTRTTADDAGIGDRVTTVRCDSGDELEPASASLILCNPPFHADTTVSTAAAESMFRHAAVVLQPGGELWCVWNSHLRYRAILERVIGPTRQVTKDPRFTVTASVVR